MLADYANSVTPVNGSFRYKRTHSDTARRYHDAMLKTRIRELREGKGWTLADLSSRAGISVSYLAEIEKHKKTVNSRRLEQIAKALGVGPHDLLQDQSDREEVAALVIDFNDLDPEGRSMVARLARSLRRSPDGG